jgi:hypothetical protein
MFGSQNIKSVNVYLTGDPAADDVLPVFVAPQAVRIVSAKAVSTNGLAADGTNHFALTLHNRGSAGTATQAISDAIGGTAGWAALTPTAFTIDADYENIASGDLIGVSYDENGTGTFTAMLVQIDYLVGQG